MPLSSVLPRCCLPILALLFRGFRPPPMPGGGASSRSRNAEGLRRESPPVEREGLPSPRRRGEACSRSQLRAPRWWSRPASTWSL